MIFSVIIPCYNCVKTLETTVNSIRICGLSDYEILLIDDGSNDGTAELCDRLCGKYEGIRCVHQSNAGVSAARNRGIDEARGEYIWFVDSDDTVDEDSLRGVLKTALLKKPDMLLFGMSFDYYNHGKMYLRETLNPPSEGMLSLQNLKDDFDEFYNCNALTPVWNKLFRSDLLKKHGTRFHEDMFLMEDYLFVLELLPLCKEIYSLKEPIYRYRQAEDERSAYRRLQRIENLAEYMQPFEQGLKTLGIPCEHVENLYSMLLKQRMYYASFSEIRGLIAQHNCGKYCRLKQSHPLKIYLCNRLVQIRHKLAVAVKNSSFYRKKQGGQKT
ncbi:MAG TPA: hypothetical protein DCY17_01100 [Clostridiales bacterium]|nr:hypothetical protein [Clostridiales bacterium]